MAARRLRNTWWADFRFRGQRHRIRSPENSRAGASAYEAVLRQRLVRGEPLVPKPEPSPRAIPKFSDFATRWYDTYVVTNNKPSEQKGKRLTLRNHLLPFLGRLRLDEISTLKVEELKALKLRSGLSPKSVNNVLAVLRKCLHCAEDWGELDRVPKIKALTVPPQRFDHLTPKEANQLINAAREPKLRAMIVVAVRSGLRLGELRALDWSDIDFEGRLLTVRHSASGQQLVSPKSNRIRHIPLTPEAFRSLQTIHQPSGFVFGAEQPLPHPTADRQLDRTCKRAGLRHIGWHVLRHTFASHLVAVGASLKVVQELLGHSDIRTTMRYSHLAPSSLHDAVQLLEPTGSQFRFLGQQAVNTLAMTMPQQTETPRLTGRF